MIDLFTTGTANGQKVSIMLEECELDYRVHIVDLVAGGHQSEAFLALNPAGKIPVITDSDGPGGTPFTLSQTLAIVLYLAEKTGILIPKDLYERAEVYRYMGLVASDTSAAFSGLFMFGVLMPQPEATAYFRTQAERQLRVLDQRLAESRYLAGEAYSVADILAYPVAVTSTKLLPDGVAGYPNLRRWAGEIGERHTVQRGMAVAAQT
jgi:GST-like protein